VGNDPVRLEGRNTSEHFQAVIEYWQLSMMLGMYGLVRLGWHVRGPVWKRYRLPQAHDDLWSVDHHGRLLHQSGVRVTPGFLDKVDLDGAHISYASSTYRRKILSAIQLSRTLNALMITDEDKAEQLAEQQKKLLYPPVENLVFKTEIKGVEVESSYRKTDSLKLDFDGGFGSFPIKKDSKETRFWGCRIGAKAEVTIRLIKPSD